MKGHYIYNLHPSKIKWVRVWRGHLIPHARGPVTSRRASWALGNGPSAHSSSYLFAAKPNSQMSQASSRFRVSWRQTCSPRRAHDLLQQTRQLRGAHSIISGCRNNFEAYIKPSPPENNSLHLPYEFRLFTSSLLFTSESITERWFESFRI